MIADGAAATRQPYVLLSAAMSVDGYIDDPSGPRLVLSGAEDLDRVDAVRAWSDAILVGAGTIRRDNPGLVVRAASRRRERLAAGRPESPAKVTLTRSGDLDPAARFFTEGTAARLVYAPAGAAARAGSRLGAAATVIAPGESLALAAVLADLAGRGVARLMVEGGSMVISEFLACGLADELQVAIAPFFIGNASAPRLVGAGRYPHGPGARMELAEVRQAGDMVLLRYLLGRRTAG